MICVFLSQYTYVPPTDSYHYMVMYIHHSVPLSPTLLTPYINLSPLCFIVLSILQIMEWAKFCYYVDLLSELMKTLNELLI